MTKFLDVGASPTVAMFKKIFSRNDVRGTSENQLNTSATTGAVLSAHLSNGSQQYLFGGEKFGGGIPFLGSSPVIYHDQIRAEVRRAWHQSTSARSLISTFVDGVVGTGLTLKPSPAASILGISQEKAEAWSRDVVDRFSIWANSKQCSSAEDMTFGQVQRLISLLSERDGEFFVRLNYYDESSRISPLSVQIIEQNQIKGNAYTVTQGMPWTNDGIERDERGREIAYQVQVRDKATGIVKTVRVPANQDGRRVMLHGFSPEYAGQGRGFSPLAHVLQEFAQITGFQLAHIQKAILQATVTLSKETAAGQTPTGNPLAGAGPRAHLPPAVLPTGTSPSCGPAPYSAVDARLNLGGIGVFNLGSGEKLVPLPNTAPVDQYAAFVDAFDQALSASVGMPVEMVKRKFGSNYSASRAVLVLAFRTFAIHRDEMISDFLSLVYEMWLASEIGAGRIYCRGWNVPTFRAAWLRANWNGPRMIDIDPQKSISAIRDALEIGVTDINTEAENYNGSDAATNIAINTRIFPTIPKAPWNAKTATPQTGDNIDGTI